MMKTYFLLGYYGQGNVGDDAILSGFLRAAKDAACTFSILSAKEGERKIARFFRALFSIKKADGVIFVGGNLLQNETSNLSLLYYLSLFWYAKRRKVPVFLFGGIGGITGNMWKSATGLCLSRAAGLYLRSSEDEQAVKMLLPRGGRVPKIGCFPDFALYLPRPMPCEKTGVILILRKNQNRSAHERLLSLFEDERKKLCLLGLSTEDFAYLQKLGKDYSLPVLVPKEPDEAMAVMAGAALCVSERYHGGIFSLLTNTPCLLEISSGKNHGLFTEVKNAAKRNGCRPPIFGFHRCSLYQRDFAGLLFDFLRKKIGGISASDFESVRRELSLPREEINPR